MGEAEFYCISGLSKCLEEYQKREEFSKLKISVQAIEKNMLSGHVPLNASNTPHVKVPLMADDTISLKVLRKMFKRAECVLVRDSFNGMYGVSRYFSMLELKGDQIFPPEGGWNTRNTGVYYVCMDPAN